MTPGIGLLLLSSCPTANDDVTGAPSSSSSMEAPQWWTAAATDGESPPHALWRCYHGRERLGSSLWRKTGALLASLLEAYPSRRFYLKLDVDTMLLPHALLRFLSALRFHGAPHAPLCAGGHFFAVVARRGRLGTAGAFRQVLWLVAHLLEAALL